ncbi:MAG: tRNA epoxyqueuosine(34) reductase QueG [Spirochaetaceae bacterium]
MGGEITPQKLSQILEAEGVRLFSTVPCVDYPDAERRYEQWVRERRYGSMEYLASHSGLKYRPARILKGCRSILFIGVPYYCGEKPKEKNAASAAGSSGQAAWYATGRDYHKTLKGILKRIIRRLSESCPDDEFRPFVDSGPLDERLYAAGSLGFIGRHGLLISPRYGSRFFLGEILTTAALPEVRPKGKETSAAKRPGGLCPESCRRCIDACPTGALGGRGSADAREAGPRFNPQHCISYLTIEYAGEIPKELGRLVGERIFGCDTCQDVCPFNREGEERAREEAPEDFIRPVAGRRISLGEISALKDREEMTRRFAGSPLMRCSLEQLKRNASIVAENT